MDNVSEPGVILELTNDEKLALIELLKRVIADDPYPLSQRVLTLKAILDKLDPPPVREPEPPRFVRGRRRR